MANSNLRRLLELPVDAPSVRTNNGQQATDESESLTASSSSSSMSAVSANMASCVIDFSILDLWGNEIQTILSGVRALTALTDTATSADIPSVNRELKELSTKVNLTN